MLKILGVFLLMLGGLILGLGAGRDLSRRLAALEDWTAALGLLEGELAFRVPTMPELLETLAHRAPAEAGQAFSAAASGMDRLGEKSLEEIWAGAVEQHTGELRPGDVELLRRLGPILGQYRWEDQRQGVEHVRTALAARAAEAREELRQKGRAYETVGLALGTFLAILLV